MSAKYCEFSAKEAQRLRNTATTYSQPLPTPTDIHDAHLSQEMTDFLLEFNKHWKEGMEERQALLEQYPESLGQFHEELMAKDIVEKDFWSRYLFRCDEQRIIRYLQRQHDAQKVKKRAQKQQQVQAQEEENEDGDMDERDESGTEFPVSVSAGSHHSDNDNEDDDSDHQTTESIMQERNIGPSLQDRLKAWGEATGSVVDEEEEQSGNDDDDDDDDQMDDADDNLSESDGSSSSALDAGGTLKERLNRYQRKATTKSRAPPSRLGGMTRSASMEVYLDADDSSTKQRDDDMSAISLPAGLIASGRSLVSVKERRKAWGATDVASVQSSADTVASAATSDASTTATKRNRPDHKIKGVSNESDRRRDARETYSTPIQRHGYESQALQQDASDFFLEFRVKLWKDDAQRQELLEECPRLKHHHQELVVETAEVADRDFWERYYFRCDEDRILREFQRAERKSALVKSIKKQKKMKYDASGEPIIVEDHDEDSSGDEDVEILLSPTEVKKFLDVNSDEALKQNVSLEVRKTGLQESTDQEIKKTVDVTAEAALKEHKSLKERKTELGDSKQEQQAKVKKVIDINADAALRENISLKERLTTLKTSSEKEAPLTKVVDPSADENLKSNVPLHERKKALAATAEKSQRSIVTQSAEPVTAEKLANVVALAKEREIESTPDENEQPTLQSTNSAVVDEDSESASALKEPEEELLRGVSSDDDSENVTEDASKTSVEDISVEADNVSEKDADGASSDSIEDEIDEVRALVGSDSEMDEKSRGDDGSDAMQSADSDRSHAQERESRAGVADSLETESEKVLDTVVSADTSDENIGSNKKIDDELPDENDSNQSSRKSSASSVDERTHEPLQDEEASSESNNEEMSIESDGTKQDEDDQSGEPDERSEQDSATSNTAQHDLNDVGDATTATGNKDVVEPEDIGPPRGDDDGEDSSMGSSVSVSSSGSEVDQTSMQSADYVAKHEDRAITAESGVPISALDENVGGNEESEEAQKEGHSSVEESKNDSFFESEDLGGDDMQAGSHTSSVKDEEVERAHTATAVDDYVSQPDQLEELPTLKKSNTSEDEIEGPAQAEHPVRRDNKMSEDEDSKHDEENAVNHDDDTQLSSSEVHDASAEVASRPNDSTAAKVQEDESGGTRTLPKDELADDPETSGDNKSEGASQSEGSSGGSIGDDLQASQQDEVDTQNSSSTIQNDAFSESQASERDDNQSESGQGSQTRSSIENGQTEIASSGSGNASEEFDESGGDEDDLGQEEDSNSEASRYSQQSDGGDDEEYSRKSPESHAIPIEQDPQSISLGDSPNSANKANIDIPFEPDVNIAKNEEDSEHDIDLNDNTNKGNGEDDELDSNENYLATGPGSLEGVTLELEVHGRSSSEGMDIDKGIDGDSSNDHNCKDIVLVGSESGLDKEPVEDKSESGTSNSPKSENVQDDTSSKPSRGDSHHEISLTDSQPENEFKDWLSEGSANSKEMDDCRDGESQGESDESSVDEDGVESADSDMTSSVEDVDIPDSKKSLGSYLDDNQKNLHAATSMETDEALVVSCGSDSDDNFDRDQVGSQIDSESEADTPKDTSSKKRKGMRGMFRRKTRVEKMRDRQAKIAARKSSENDADLDTTVETSVKRSKRRTNPLKSLGRKLGNRGKAKEASGDAVAEGSDRDDADSYTSERDDNNGKWDDNSEPQSTIKKRSNPLKQLGRRLGKNRSRATPSETANSEEIEEYERADSSDSNASSSEYGGRRDTVDAASVQRSDGESNDDSQQQAVRTIQETSDTMIRNSSDDAGLESGSEYGSDDEQDEGDEMDLKTDNDNGDDRPATKRGAKDDDSTGNRSQNSFGRLKNRFKKFGQRRRKKNGDEDENVDKVINIEMGQKDDGIEDVLDDLSSDDGEAASDNEVDNYTGRGKSGEDFDDNRSQGSFGRFKNRFKKLGRRRGKKKGKTAAENVGEESDHNKTAGVRANSKVDTSCDFDEVASKGGVESSHEHLDAASTSSYVPLAGHESSADDSDDNRSQSSFGKFKDRFKKLGRRRQKTSTDEDDNIDKVVEVQMGVKDDTTSDFGDFVADDGAMAANDDSGLNTRENVVDDKDSDDDRSQRSFGRLKDRFKKFGRKRGKKEQPSNENNGGSDSDSDDSVDIQAYQAPRSENERGNPSRLLDAGENANTVKEKSVDDHGEAIAGKDGIGIDSKSNPRDEVREDVHTDYHEGDMDINLKDEINVTATISVGDADDGSSSKADNRSQRSIKGRLKSFGRRLGKGRREKSGSFDDDTDGSNLVHEESSSFGANSKTSLPRDNASNEMKVDDTKVGDGAESVDESYISDGNDDAADGDQGQDCSTDVKQGKRRKNVLKLIRKKLGGRSQEKNNEDDNNSSNTPADPSSKEMVDREDSFGASGAIQLPEKQTQKRRNVLKDLQRKFGDRGSEKQGSAQPLLDEPGSEGLSNKDGGIDGGYSRNSNEDSHISMDSSMPAKGEKVAAKDADGGIQAEASEKKKSSQNLFGFMKGGMRSDQNRKGNKHDGESVKVGDISSSFDNQDASERSMRSESSNSSTYSKSRKNPLRTISQLFKGKTKKQVVHTVQPVAFEDNSEFSDNDVTEKNHHDETPNKVEVSAVEIQSDARGMVPSEKTKDTKSLQQENSDSEDVKPTPKTATPYNKNSKLPALTDDIIESLKSGTNHLDVPADLSSDEEDDTGKSNYEKLTPTEAVEVVKKKQPDSMTITSPKAKQKVEKTKSGVVKKVPNIEKAHPKTETRDIPASGKKGKNKKDNTAAHEGERSRKNFTDVHEKQSKKRSAVQRSVVAEKESVKDKVGEAEKNTTDTVKAKSEYISKLTKTPKKTNKVGVEVDMVPPVSKDTTDGEDKLKKKSIRKPNKKKMKSQTSASSNNEDLGKHSSAALPRVKSPKPKKNKVQAPISSSSDDVTEKSDSDPSNTKSPKPKKNKVHTSILPTDSKDDGSNLENSKSPKPKKSKVQILLSTKTEDITRQSASDLASSKSPKPKKNKVHTSSKSEDVTKQRGSDLVSSKSPKPKKNKVLKKGERVTDQSDLELATLKSPKPKKDKLPKDRTAAEVKSPKPKSEKKDKAATKSGDDFAAVKEAAASETVETVKKEKKKKKTTLDDKREVADYGVVKKVEKKKKTVLDGDKDEDTKLGVADKAEKKKKKLPKSVEESVVTVDAAISNELDQSKLKKKKVAKAAQQKESVEETKKVEKLSKKKKSKSVTKD